MSVLSERVTDLAEFYGGLRALGAAIDVDPAYLSRIRAGTKPPSARALAKLGLVKVVEYRLAQTAKAV